MARSGSASVCIAPAQALDRWRSCCYYLQIHSAASRARSGTTARPSSEILRRERRDARCRSPLVPEQRRIVDALESYFTRLDDAIATLERVQANLKRYRASVLKAAVEGRLVPTEAELARAEGRDYEPASVLLERILAERRRRWEEAELAKMKAKGKAPKDDKWKAKYEEPAAPDTTSCPSCRRGGAGRRWMHLRCGRAAMGRRSSVRPDG